MQDLNMIIKRYENEGTLAIEYQTQLHFDSVN